jgi:hypothetical protein
VVGKEQGKVKRMKKHIFKMVACLCAVLWLEGCVENGSRNSGDLRQVLSDNFDENEARINELVEFFGSIVPEQYEVSFGFGDSRGRFEFGILKIDTLSSNRIVPNLGGNDLLLDSPEMDEKLAILHWTSDQLDTLKMMLENVNCVGISSGEPICLDYGCGGPYGLASMFYLLFKQGLSDSLRKQYNRMEGYSVYRDNVVLQVGYPL